MTLLSLDIYIREIEVKPGYGENTVLRYPAEGNDSYAHDACIYMIKYI